MTLVLSLYLLLVGVCFGSFALAMADRLHNKKDWVRGRSECDSCNTKLTTRDLIPIVSWLFAKGKCRYCGVSLPVTYPLMELGVGAVFVGSYLFWPVELASIATIAQFVVWLLAVVLMSVLFIYDLRWFKLPFIVLHPLIVLSIVWAGIDVYETGFSSGVLVQYGLSVLVGAGVFQLLYTISKGSWIGDADIRLGVAIGFFVGTALEAWLAIFIGSVIGLLLSAPAIITTKKNSKRLKLKMPFGPPLLIALVLVVLFGASAIEWYKVNLLYL